MSEKNIIKLMFKKNVIFNTLYLSAIAFVTYSIIRNSITSNPRILVEIKEPIIPLIIFQIIIISWNIIYHTRIFSSQRMRINVIKKKESVMIGLISVVLSLYYLLRAFYLRYINNVNITQYKRNEHIISFSLGVIFFILFAFVIYIGRQKQIPIFSRKHVLKIIRKNLLIILIILSLITYNSFVNYMTDDSISDLENRLNIDRGDLTLTFRHQNSWIGYSLNLTKLSDISTINKFLPHIEFGIELIINKITTDIRITLFDDNYFANYSWTPSRSLDLDNVYIDSRIYNELNLNDEIKIVDLTGNEIISTSQLVPFDKTNSSFSGFGGITTSINTWESLGFDLWDRIYNYIDQDFEFLIKLNSRDDYDRNNFISTLSSTFEMPDSLFDIIELNNGEKRLSEEIKIKSSLNIVSLILFVSVGIILGYLLLFDK